MAQKWEKSEKMKTFATHTTNIHTAFNIYELLCFSNILLLKFLKEI